MDYFKIPRISGSIPEQISGIRSALTQIVRQLNHMSAPTASQETDANSGDDGLHYTKKATDALLEDINSEVSDLGKKLRAVEQDFNRFLEDYDKNAGVDSVSERGTSNGWVYELWKSGHIKFWSTISVTIPSSTTAKATYVDLPFDITFPRVLGQVDQQTWRLSSPLGIQYENGQIKVSIYINSQASDVTISVNLFGTGTLRS